MGGLAGDYGGTGKARRLQGEGLVELGEHWGLQGGGLEGIRGQVESVGNIRGQVVSSGGGSGGLGASRVHRGIGGFGGGGEWGLRQGWWDNQGDSLGP